MNHSSTRMPHVALAATIWFEQALDTAMPIAMPLLVGPGSISATIIYMERGAGWEHKSLSVAVLALMVASVNLKRWRLR